jgi:hypothetical protein
MSLLDISLSAPLSDSQNCLPQNGIGFHDCNIRRPVGDRIYAENSRSGCRRLQFTGEDHLFSPFSKSGFTFDYKVLLTAGGVLVCAMACIGYGFCFAKKRCGFCNGWFPWLPLLFSKNLSHACFLVMVNTR